jgi:tRNA G46 methylase TrmB
VIDQVRQLLNEDATFKMSAANQSIFYDIGSGYGKICWHAALQFQVRSLGSEIHAGRVEFASITAAQYLSNKLPSLPLDTL